MDNMRRLVFAKELERQVYNDDIVFRVENGRAEHVQINLYDYVATDLEDLEVIDTLYLRVPSTGNLFGADSICRANYLYLERNPETYPGLSLFGGYAYVKLSALTTEQQLSKIAGDFRGFESGYPVYSDDILAEVEAEDCQD